MSYIAYICLTVLCLAFMYFNCVFYSGAEHKRKDYEAGTNRLWFVIILTLMVLLAFFV